MSRAPTATPPPAQGTATRDSDKLALVLPVLGLYIQLYASRDLPHVAGLFSHINKHGMFPRTAVIDGETKELFGNLLSRAEHMVDHNAAFREKARSHHVNLEQRSKASSPNAAHRRRSAVLTAAKMARMMRHCETMRVETPKLVSNDPKIF